MSAKKRPSYKTYSQTDIDKALQYVRDGNSINKAADLYGVPRSTLKDKVAGRTPIETSQGPDPVLTKAEEEEIVVWAINMAKIGYGRTKEEIFEVVKKLLEKYPRPNPFPNNKPGRQWWCAFLRRHPRLVLRKPENLSKARAVSCTKEAIFKWFRELRSFINDEAGDSELLTDPARIYNADEAGFPMSPNSECKVVAELGSKDVYSVTSSDRTQITVLACGNAAGTVIPPMMIFPGERFKYNPLHNGVPNTYLARTKNGWIDSEVFYMWMANHFVNYISPVRPVLLLVDGHSTHLDKNTTDFCKSNGIILYCLPAHASHIVQPLDVAFFRPLKRNWKKFVKQYRDANPGQCLTKMVFSSVFRPTWVASNRPESLINGFKDSGIYPFNPEAIDARKFTPSLVYVPPPDHNIPSAQPMQPAAIAPAVTVPVQPTAIAPAVMAHVQPGAIAPAATAPVQPTAIAPAVMAHVQPGAIAPAAMAPLQPTAISTAGTAPMQLAAIAPAAMAPVQPTAIAPAVMAPVQPTAIAPAVMDPVQPTAVAPAVVAPKEIVVVASRPPFTLATAVQSSFIAVPILSDPVAQTATAHVQATTLVSAVTTPLKPSAANTAALTQSTAHPVTDVPALVTPNSGKVYLGHKISPVLEGIISYPSIVKSTTKRRNDMPKALTGKQMEQYLQIKTEEKIEKEQKKIANKEKRKANAELKRTNKAKKNKHEQSVVCKVCNREYDEKLWYEWVGCDGECGYWFCLKCTDINVDAENKDPRDIASEISETEWFCSSCLK